LYRVVHGIDVFDPKFNIDAGVLANGLIDAAWEFIEQNSVLPHHPPSGSYNM